MVVFVLATVFLLVLTIVFYAGQTDALDQAARAEKDLANYVTPQQRNMDQYKNFEQAAGRQSVAAYLNGRFENLMAYVDGSPGTSMEKLQADFERFAVNDSVRATLDRMQRDLRNDEIEIESLERKLADRDEEIAEKDAEIARMKEAHQDELNEVTQEIVAYREAAEQYQRMVNEAIADWENAQTELEDQYRGQITDLEDELDAVGQELVLARSRLNEFEGILDEIRFKAKDPAELVDAQVIDTDPANEQVFINRGRNDRIVLGMSFEVYDDDASISVNPETRMLPRGKASVKVVKVGETTSTCKITRSVRGRPVVRNDVLANAVYDPERRFKFLIHSKFDVDGDGRPSEAEAEYLRSLVVEWGGEVVFGNELPGDLDFLVLGEQPPLPPPLPPGATDLQISEWLRKRQAHERYNELFRRASEAQIPVLNSNRFFILIGHSGR
ncbi:MAG: hypothetical protein SYC29_18040 [Planctomycetota bacterium]|nr:hypothetical protein [Planctomycetota bacterium]